MSDSNESGQPLKSNLQHRTARPGLQPGRPSHRALAAMKLFGALVLFIAMAMLPTRGWTQTAFKDDDPSQPWQITADIIQHFQDTGQFIARGNVKVSKQNKSLTADYVRFDHPASLLIARGNVVLTIDEDRLTGDSLVMDIEAEQGTITNGTIFVKSNNYLIRGNRISKTGPATYTIDEASFSTCEGDPPDWRITGKDLKVELEGYGTAKNAVLWARNLPVAYTPIILFPAKKERQTGLLAPEFGLSDRKGLEFLQPFFWEIGDTSDATFYAHYMSLRGMKLGAEYRYVLDESSKGVVQFDYFHDNKIDDGLDDSSQKWGYTDDNYLRTNRDRYWFRAKADQRLPFGFFAMLDLDIVSDQDYLHEFEDGYTGFEQSKEYFARTFGRDLDEAEDTVRLNRLNLKKLWPRYSLNIEARWLDNVINRRFDLEDTTLQRLPNVLFSAVKQPVEHLPLYYDLSASYTLFYRQEGTRGQRLDAHPRVYLPLRWKSYLSFEPSVGLRQTVWYVDEYDDSISEQERFFSRTLPDFKGDLSSEVYRIYPWKWGSVDRLKHTIRPRLVYEYIPYRDQDNLPSFDTIDRISKKNLVTYSVTNTVTSRSEIPAVRAATAADPAVPDYLYRQALRVQITQSYDIAKERDGDPDPFSPIEIKLQMNPFPYLSVQGDANWSVYDDHFVSRNIAANIVDGRGDKLFVEHRYTEDIRESLFLEANLNLTHGYLLYSNYERNIELSESILTTLGILYEAQCWSLDVRYRKKPQDYSLDFLLHLYGLGKLKG